MSILLTTW